MTKEEFNKYIKSFHKNAGEYTEEEVYEIGRKHKTLPLGDRNWNELAGRLGSIGQDGKPRNGEALRTFIKKKQYDDGTIIHNEKMLSGQTVDGLTFPEAEQKISELKRSLYIEGQKTRDEKNDYRRTLRDEARIQRIIDTIKEAIAKLPELPKFKEEKYIYDDNAEAVLMFSDMHIGTFVDGFYNKFNIEIAKKRVNKLINDTIRYCKQNNVKTLNFLNLGDNIQGLIHVTGRVTEEVDTITQVMTAAEILAEVLVKLSSYIPEVVYRSCLDNHSRAIANYKEHIEKESFGRLIDFYLKARLKDSSIIFAEDNLDENIGLVKLKNGQKLIFVHGHQDNINTTVQSYVAATKSYIDYVCLGHFHNTKMKSFLNSKVFVNGSILGTDDYALSHRLFADPEQTLLLFEGKNLINITVRLTEKE